MRLMGSSCGLAADGESVMDGTIRSASLLLCSPLRSLPFPFLCGLD